MGGGRGSRPVAFEDLAHAVWMQKASFTDFPATGLRDAGL